MKVLVILLSDQHIPNLLSVEAVRPEIIAYVETDEMKKAHAWKNLGSALEINGIKIDSEGFFLENENSFKAIKEIFQGIKDQYADEDIIVNLTGGTKMMSIGAYDVFKDSGAVFIYKPFKYINEFLDMRSDSRKEFKSEISIRQFLKGYGFEISSSDSEIEKHLNESWLLFEISSYLAERHNNYTIRGCLSNIARINFNDGREYGDLRIDISDELKTDDPVLKKFLVGQLGMESIDEEVLQGSLSRKYVRFLTGEWLEIFIWGILNEYGHLLGYRNPIHSLTIFKRNEPGVTMNELDVVFLKGTRLCIIECKTGKQEQDTDANNVIYKLKSVMESLRALDVHGYLVTTSENLVGKDGKVKPHIASRLSEYGVGLILSRDVLALARARKENRTEEIMRLLSNLFN